MDTHRKKQSQKSAALVLIVDDIEENVEVLYSILKNENYRFAIALTAEQTLRTVEKEVPDLILLDVMLTDGNGFELAERILRDHGKGQIPIIFITARAHIEDKVMGFQAGGVDYITKPFEESEVLARVRTHLELKSIQKEQQELIRQLREALDEVRQLRGIIPICARCKKIRDDDGYWMQVDQYFSVHSDIEFSHGLCPECMHELYPDLVDEKNQEEKNTALGDPENEKVPEEGDYHG